MVRTSDILGGVFRADIARRVSKSTYLERIGRAEPSHGDLLYSREGTYFGVAAEVPADTKVCLGQRMVLLRPNPNLVHPSFLRYWLNSPGIQAHIRGHRDGSVAERLNVSTIRRLPVCMPNLPEQRRVVAVFNAIDDKIELNRRMNHTLEEMTQAIFKSWFVDFDGQVEFEDSGTELGDIPKEWSVQPFSQVIDVLGGGTPKRSVPEYWGGQVPWVSAKDASQCPTVHVIDTEECATEAGIASSSAKLRPAGTTVITARGTVGKTVLLPEPMAYNQSCYGLLPKNERWIHLVFLATRSLIDTFQRRSHGAIFDTITHRTFQSVQVVWPTSEVGDRFEQTVKPLFDRMLLNARQSRTLAELRDTLLPKLISGEIRVPEAEEAVEDAT